MVENLMMSDCRAFLLENTEFTQIAPNLPKVFVDAQVDSLVFIASKAKGSENSIQITDVQDGRFVEKHSILQKNFLKNDKFIFTVEVNKGFENILAKMNKQSAPLAEYFEITRGMNPYDSYRGQSREVIDNKAYHASYQKDNTFVPEIRGKHVNRYFHQWDGLHFISYGEWLAAPRDPKFFKGERIVFREILGKNFECTYLTEDIKIDRSLYIALPNSDSKKFVNAKYVLALLASKLLALCFRYASNEFDSLFPKIRLAEFKNLPIRKYPFPNKNLLFRKSK